VRSRRRQIRACNEQVLVTFQEEEQVHREEPHADHTETIPRAPEEKHYAGEEPENVEVPPVARVRDSAVCAGWGKPTIETLVHKLADWVEFPACFERER